MKKKIAIIGTNGLPAKYGGFETLTNYLVKYLADDYEFFVYCPKTEKNKRVKMLFGANLIYMPFKANGWQSIIYDMVSLLHAQFICKFSLVLGASGTLIFPIVKLSGMKIAFNFGGFEWKRSKWNKFVLSYLKFAEKIGVNYSDFIVADNQVFIDYVLEVYKKQSELIAYGGNHITKIVNTVILDKYSLSNNGYFLSIARAQKDNNIHLLLEAFSSIKDKKLVIISNWNVSEYGKDLKDMYKGYANILLLDAIYDIEVLNTLRTAAYCYIHTHSECGSAPSLIEAMFFGKPIISFDVETNRYTTEEKALFFKSSQELHRIINNSKMISTEIGVQLEQIANKRYTWELITDSYKRIFNV